MKNDVMKAEFIAPDVLSCGQHRKFWISWKENTIMVRLEAVMVPLGAIDIYDSKIYNVWLEVVKL